MTIDIHRRQKILRKIYRIPYEKLNELEEFISKIELTPDKKSKTLSFAGAWENLDESTFVTLTDDLIRNRKRNARRENK